MKYYRKLIQRFKDSRYHKTLNHNTFEAYPRCIFFHGIQLKVEDILDEEEFLYILQQGNMREIEEYIDSHRTIKEFDLIVDSPWD